MRSQKNMTNSGRRKLTHPEGNQEGVRIVSVPTSEYPNTKEARQVLKHHSPYSNDEITHVEVISISEFDGLWYVTGEVRSDENPYTWG